MSNIVTYDQNWLAELHASVDMGEPKSITNFYDMAATITGANVTIKALALPTDGEFPPASLLRLDYEEVPRTLRQVMKRESPKENKPAPEAVTSCEGFLHELVLDESPLGLSLGLRVVKPVFNKKHRQTGRMFVLASNIISPMSVPQAEVQIEQR